MRNFSLCVNTQEFIHTQYVEQTSIDPLHWFAENQSFPKIYLKTEKKTRAACGAHLVYQDPPTYGKNNTSPLAFYGGCRFPTAQSAPFSPWANFPDSIFFAPQEEFINTDKGSSLFVHKLSGPGQIGTLPRQKSILTTAPGQVLWDQIIHTPQKEEWLQLVTNTIQKIKQGYYQKIVHARLSQIPIRGHLSPITLLRQLEAQYKKGTLFFIQFSPKEAFLGITPERLFYRKEQNITVDALAGTAPLTQYSFSLSELEIAPVYTPKNYQEFLFVKSSIESSLYKLIITGSWKDQDRAKNVGTIQHLYNEYQALLKPFVSDKEIIQALHPTAAIGGLPKKLALHFLSKIAYFDRGWYSSPIGYLTTTEAEFYVAIRASLVQPCSLFLFAGAGITEDSSPEEEWEELNQKIRTIYRGNLESNMGKTFN